MSEGAKTPRGLAGEIKGELKRLGVFDPAQKLGGFTAEVQTVVVVTSTRFGEIILADPESGLEILKALPDAVDPLTMMGALESGGLPVEPDAAASA